MSAFIVDDLHINAIVTWAIERQISYYEPATQTSVDITLHNAEAVGRILMDENVRSVCARYQSADWVEKNAGAGYRFAYFATPLSAMEVIKACRCLEYQSCETEDWESSLAWRILQTITARAVQHLPGWDDAPWALTRETAKQLTHAGRVSLVSIARGR